jgi:hypothetical protein
LGRNSGKMVAYIFSRASHLRLWQVPEDILNPSADEKKMFDFLFTPDFRSRYP